MDMVFINGGFMNTPCRGKNMLAKDVIIRCLKRLGEELKEIGVNGEILLAGGAAMCLVHSARDMTKDIDALYEPKVVINQLAKAIAEQENLPEDWLNDGVKGYIGHNAPANDFMVFGNLKVSAVAPEYLLSMKLMSSRFGETDADDIRFLLAKMDIRSSDEAMEVLSRFFPPSRILPKTIYMLQECIEANASRRRP